MISFCNTRIATLHAILAFGVCGCGSFDPTPIDEVPFRDRALTKQDGEVRVSTVVLSAEESEQIFDADLYRRGIQPVWLEIENNEDSPIYFLAAGTDPEYFAPLEVSYIHRARFAKFANQQMDEYFYRLAMQHYVRPGETERGFVYTHLQHGTKAFNVDLVGEDHRLRSFTFFVPVPGLEADYEAIDFAGLYPADAIVEHDLEDLRAALRELPCCLADANEIDLGQPLNVILVGEGEDILYSLIRSGWDTTGKIANSSTKSKRVAGTEERYRPVSIRYAFGRPQDASFRKSRHGIHPRSHLRLWLTPLRLDGVPVWIGEVGRDVARPAASSDHAPDADDARNILVQDLLYAQAVKTVGYTQRLSESLEPRKRQTLTGAPFYADGFRAFIVVSGTPISLAEVQSLPWDVPVWE